MSCSETRLRNPPAKYLHFLDDDEKYTYLEFDELSNRLAHGLLAQGVEQGDRSSTVIEYICYALVQGFFGGFIHSHPRFN